MVHAPIAILGNLPLEIVLRATSRNFLDRLLANNVQRVASVLHRVLRYASPASQAAMLVQMKCRSSVGCVLQARSKNLEDSLHAGNASWDSLVWSKALRHVSSVSQADLHIRMET